MSNFVVKFYDEEIGEVVCLTCSDKNGLLKIVSAHIDGDLPVTLEDLSGPQLDRFTDKMNSLYKSGDIS